MTHVVHALLRAPTQLLVLSAETDRNSSRLLLLPLSTLPPRLRGGYAEVLGSWERLARARPGDLGTAEAAARVCRASIPDLPWRGAPGRGATHQDLRTWLSAPAACRMLLHRPGGPAPSVDPYFGEAHGYPGLAFWPSLPRDFRRLVLPGMVGLCWSAVRRALGSWFCLAPGGCLGLDSPLAFPLAHLVRVHRGPRLARWLQVLARCPPSGRPGLAAAVAESGAAAPDPDTVPEEALEALQRGRGGAGVYWQAHRRLQALAEDGSASRLRQGLALAAQAGRAGTLPPMGPAGPMEATCFERPLALLGSLEPGSWREAAADACLGAWARPGLRPGLAARLASVAWEDLPPPVAGALLSLLTGEDLDQGWDPASRARERRLWEQLVGQLPELLRWGGGDASRPPEARARALGLVRDLWSQEDGDPGWLTPALPALCLMAEGLAQAAASEVEHLAIPHIVLRELAGVTRDLKDAVASWPPACFRALARAGSSATAERYAVPGLGLLARQAPGVLLDGLGAWPEATLRAAGSLGTLQTRVRRRVLARWWRHPLVQVRLSAQPDWAALRALEAALVPGVRDPFSRRLRAHVRGEITLSPGSLRGHLRRLGQGLLICRLGLLDQLAMTALGRGIEAPERPSPAVRHALAMAHRCEQNRAPLRELLQATFRGQDQHLVGHPRSLEWRSRHPSLPFERWWNGLEQHATVARLGRIRLRVERDPLEVLRAGTYVQTCTSLGGSYMDSSAGLAVDVNKAVVYARDAQGRVLARQLLAISRDTRLIPYWVYTTDFEEPGDGLRRAFLEFDRAFASVLGLPLGHADECRPAPIERVLSQSWYDDGEWRP